MPVLDKKHVTFKIFLLLVGVDLVETIAQFCFKKSAISLGFVKVGALSDAANFIISALASPYFWVGLFSVILIFISWSTILSKIDLSVAVPVCSFSYITIPLVSVIFFKEKISVLRWAGIFIILCGVILVSMSSRSKESA